MIKQLNAVFFSQVSWHSSQLIQPMDDLLWQPLLTAGDLQEAFWTWSLQCPSFELRRLSKISRLHCVGVTSCWCLWVSQSTMWFPLNESDQAYWRSSLISFYPFCFHLGVWIWQHCHQKNQMNYGVHYIHLGSKARMHVSSIAPTHKALMLLPAILAFTLFFKSWTWSFGAPLNIDCDSVVGKTCEQIISSPVRNLFFSSGVWNKKVAICNPQLNDC